ncbi:MAG: oxidoreductase [Chloroflexi bacterium]|nr:oxidoreductase [Chloroflexota bacterium]
MEPESRTNEAIYVPDVHRSTSSWIDTDRADGVERKPEYEVDEGGLVVTPYMQATNLAVPVTHRDHVQGPDAAPVTLVEYGDFECPYCGAAHQVIKAIQGQLGDQLRFVFRHFPLVEVHPHAEPAAEASEAAAAQDHFWEMHDTLFEHQRALDYPHLLSYARALGLDIDRFEREMAAHIHEPRVREDFLSGVLSGVNGTPTFFINGERYSGSYDYATLLLALHEAGAR